MSSSCRPRFLLHCFLALALFVLIPHPALATSPAAGPGTGDVRGVVVDRTTRQPIAQANVALVGVAFGAATGDDGRFAITGVPAGTYRLRAWRIDYPALLLSDVVVTRGRATEAVVELEIAAPSTKPVEVHAHGFARKADVPTTSYQLSFEEIRRSPGAIGDVLRLVQSLPGMAMANDQRNDIIARGGSPNENFTLVDNVDVPTLNHFAAQGSTGGPISMLDNELVRDATFLAGGFPAEYAGRLSSVLDVRLRDGDRQRVRSEATLSMAGAGLVLEGPMGARGAWIGSVRQGYLDLIAGSFGLIAVPHTTGWQLKGTYDLGAHDKVWMLGLGGRDDIHVKPKDDDPEDPNTIDVDFRGWRQVTGGNWQHLFGTRAWGTLGVSDAVYRYETDAYAQEIDGALAYRNRSTEGVTTLKYDAALRTARWGDWKAGAHVMADRNTFDVAQPHGMLNPYSTDTTRVDRIAFALHERSTDLSAYVQSTLHAGHVLDVTVGATAERFGALDAAALSPRTGLTVHLTPVLDLNLAYGRYRQAPPLVLVDAAPGNRDLEPMRADHVVAGLQFLPAPDLRLTLETYLKTYADYPVSVAYPSLSLANTGDQYGVYDLLMPLVSRGTGRARGVEFYLQKKLTGRWYGQVSATLSRAEHRGLDGVLRRGGYDSPLTLNLIAGWQAGAAWELSTKASYASGRPFTPPLEPVSTQQNRYVFDLDRINGARAREYQRCDVRVDRHTRAFGRDLAWFFEAQNVFDRRNVFQYVWNSKTRRLAAVDQIHFFPVGGFTLKF